MAEHRDNAGPLAGRSAQRIRQASGVLAVGAAIIPPEMPEEAPEDGERRPILRRQASLRVQTPQHLQRRLADETWKRWWPLFALLFFVLMVVHIVNVYYAIVHFLTVCYNWTKPCDQLLHYYLCTLLVVSYINSQFTSPQLTSCFGHKGMIAGFLIGFVMGWCCIGWGLTMVWECKTCQETNPELYNSAKDLIYMRLVFIVMASVILCCASVGALRFFAMIETRSQPGCPTAIAKLPRVQPDAEELLDPEDNKVMDCPICQDSLDAKGTKVLRTECGHHYHVGCLEQWGKSHLDCPMCREMLGPPDNPPDNEEPV